MDPQHFDPVGQMPGQERPVYREDEDHVPDGSVADVLAWVGGDPHRARVALAAEGERRDEPRRTLTGPLEDILAEDGGE